MKNITYIIGSDHAGLSLSMYIMEILNQKGLKVLNLCPNATTSVDYPDYAQKVCETMRDITESIGILVCGSGIGMSIAANRYKHIRAALCTDAYMAAMARMHNDANVLCLGERVIGKGKAMSILEAFITSSFEGQRHKRRVDKLRHIRDSIKAK